MGLGPRQPEPVPAPLRFHRATIAPPQPCAGQGEKAGSKHSLLHFQTLLRASFQEGYEPKAPVATLKSLGRGKALAERRAAAKLVGNAIAAKSAGWEGVLMPHCPACPLRRMLWAHYPQCPAQPCRAPRSAPCSGTADFCPPKEEVFCSGSCFPCRDLGAARPAHKNPLEMQR